MIRAILFDFGGVIAEEGFREGLKAIAAKNGTDPDRFYALADGLIGETGYLTGRAGEHDYWNALRERTGVGGTDQELRNDILQRFVLRPPVISLVDRLRVRGFLVALLTDQTNWLFDIDRETGVLRHFDRVFNSLVTHMSKRQPETFFAVCRMLGVEPGETVFIDDNDGHVRRAASAGMNVIHYTTFRECAAALRLLTGIDHGGNE